MNLLETNFLSNSILSWLVAASILTLVILVGALIRYLLARQVDRQSNKTDSVAWPVVAAMIRRTKWLFILIFGVFVATTVLEIPDHINSKINKLIIIALLIQTGLWAGAMVKVIVKQYRERQISKDPAGVTTLNVLNFISMIIIWSLVLLLILDNMGINITALVAGLGVGGIAVALAVQTILGDLFASLSIVLDKPFVVGDFLIIGDLLGSVEYVGLKTTRLRSLSGEQLIFSNSDLLNSRIRNYGRMFERRVVFNIGVTYQTPREHLIEIPNMIRSAVESQEKTRFDRSNFKEYGDFSLVYESVYYVQGPDYNLYMDIQQAVNLSIHEQFENAGIEFAYPTQTLFLRKESESE